MSAYAEDLAAINAGRGAPANAPWRVGPSASELSPELDLRVLGPLFGWEQVRDGEGRLTPMWRVPRKVASEKRAAL